MKILAVGGAVIKTALEELKIIAGRGLFNVLIHNGGSLFHDFQLATESIKGHSYPLEDLIKNPDLNRKASELVWKWIRNNRDENAYWERGRESILGPEGSVTRLCETRGIRIMVFTVLGGDFWHLFDKSSIDWGLFAFKTKKDFYDLCEIMRKEKEFHYICMGSAVVHPEIFTKAVAFAKPKKFRADVVDFLPNQYRPETRVSKYGKYYQTTHKEFLNNWIKCDDEGIDIFTGEKYE
jgi:hypothetical protein